MSTPAVMESFTGPLSLPVEARPDNWYPRMRSHPPLWPHHGRAHRLVASSSRTTTCAVTIGIITLGESVQTDHLDVLTKRVLLEHLLACSGDTLNVLFYRVLPESNGTTSTVARPTLILSINGNFDQLDGDPNDAHDACCSSSTARPPGSTISSLSSFIWPPCQMLNHLFLVFLTSK